MGCASSELRGLNVIEEARRLLPEFERGTGAQLGSGRSGLAGTCAGIDAAATASFAPLKSFPLLF